MVVIPVDNMTEHYGNSISYGWEDRFSAGIAFSFINWSSKNPNTVREENRKNRSDRESDQMWQPVPNRNEIGMDSIDLRKEKYQVSRNRYLTMKSGKIEFGPLQDQVEHVLRIGYDA